MVFVNRGNSLGGLPAALRAMSNVRAWARRPKRLHFHLLADEQQHGAVSAMTTLGAQAGLPLTVHNASDAALQARLPPLGLATLVATPRGTAGQATAIYSLSSTSHSPSSVVFSPHRETI